MKEQKMPDILIPYDARCIENGARILPLFVRPETNKVNYESLIVQAFKDLGDVVFMANYNGEVIRQRKIVVNHYFSQYLFALHGKHEIAKYPEFMDAFEEKFKVAFTQACILGAFEFLSSSYNKGYSDESLFGAYVEDTDFLMFLGNTIKRIGECYIVNYDLPCIFNRYNQDSNILVLALQLHDDVDFQAVNYAIYEKLHNDDMVEYLGDDEKIEIEWQETVKRTYHIAHNHIEAMFDLTDYTVYQDGTPIRYRGTPLGRELIRQNVISEEEIDGILNYFKKFPLIYLDKLENKKLINIRKAGVIQRGTKTVEQPISECVDLFMRIVM